MALRDVAVGWLVLAWAGWVLPIAMAARRRRGQTVSVRQPGAKWGILLEGVACALAWWQAPARSDRPVPVLAAAMALAAASAVCGWWAVHHLGEHWRLEAALSHDHRLVRSGPYRYVRHPIYASLFGMMLATGLIVGRWPLLLVAIPVFLVGTEIRIRAEDALLTERFGEEFADYRSRVTAYIPFVR